jgi:hypothetical protein
VVFTAPPSVWGDIEIVPFHPRDVIGLLGMGAAAKFFSNVKERFWVRDGFAPLGGSLEVGQVWEGTDNQTRRPGQDIVLSVFTGMRIPSVDEYKKGLNVLYPSNPRDRDSGYLRNLRRRCSSTGRGSRSSGPATPDPGPVRSSRSARS